MVADSGGSMVLITGLYSAAASQEEGFLFLHFDLLKFLFSF